LLWTQPLLIGLFLAGEFDRLAAHGMVGGILVLAVFVQFLLSIPAWRPGGMHGAAVAVAAAMVAGVVVQIVAGIQRNLGVHVPLGVTLAAAGAAVTICAWWPARPATAEQPANAPHAVPDAGAGPYTGTGPDAGTVPNPDWVPTSGMVPSSGTDSGQWPR
jgi:hypothetical protein